MKSPHLEQLKTWISSSNNLHELRTILGKMLHTVNEASYIFKKSIRKYAPENIGSIKTILADISNFENFKLLLPSVEEKVNNIGGDYSNVIKNILHTLENSHFNYKQIKDLEQVASETIKTDQDFPEETNKEGLDNLLNKSIYNLKNPSDKTLKVIREVLQNAVDATDPQQHPELTKRHDYKPEIHINYYKHNEGYIDIIIKDKGIGMNWDILSRKFFVTFDSGKSNDSQAAGGFGIAKALIQETPKHGWSIDTNGIHSSRFHKNLYFGTRQGSGYNTPSSKIQKDSGGTTLSLYGLPDVSTYSIESLCKVYATNGRVAIFLNNNKIEPNFTLNSPEIKSMDNLDNLSDLISNNAAEKEVADNVLDKFKDNISEKLKDISLYTDNKTKVKFFVKKTSSYSGKLYVMVNGQYQFDSEEYINKLDIICSIQTIARPGDDDYPLDPGRGMVKGKIGEEIKQIVSSVKEFTSKASDDELFKQGIEAIMVNPDSNPMSTTDDESTVRKKDQLRDALFADLSSTMKYSEEDKTQEMIRSIEGILGELPIVKKQVFKNLLSNVVQDENDRIEQKKKLDAIIEGLLTPANIMIQRNFVGREAINNRMDLISEITILWQKTLKLLMAKMAESGRYGIRKKNFIPGMIFSDEVLGLYMPADETSGRPYASVSINPITLAAAINPKTFNDKLTSNQGREAFQEIPNQDEDKKASNDTPTNRVAKFLFHIGLHELTHLLYPDSYGSDNFHKNITKLEIVCHDAFDDIREETKRYMKQLRSKSNMLINLIAKNKKMQESVDNNNRYDSSRNDKYKLFIALIHEIIKDRM